MKKSIIVQPLSVNRSNKNVIKKQEQKNNLVINTFDGSLANEPNVESILKMMEVIIEYQNTIQAYKQSLNERTDFNPEALFQYISSSEMNIDKKHILILFQENQIKINEQHIKLYFHSYGYKDKINYSAFLNLIYPVDVDLLKYISITGIKKYNHNSKINSQILCVFLLLVNQQIKLLQKLDDLKNQSLAKINRKQIKQIMRFIKKSGQCKSQMEIQSQNFIKFEELKGFFRYLAIKNAKRHAPTSARGSAKKSQHVRNQSQINVYSNLDKHMSCIFRKLSMTKNNFINLEDLQFWLRPWGLKTKLNPINEQLYPAFSNVIQISGLHEVDNWNEINLHQNFPLSLRHNE